MITILFGTRQFAAQRHEELIAEATNYRQTRTSRSERVSDSPPRSESARRIGTQVRSVFRTWYAAGEL
jgi:hypothetical protein